MSCLQKLAPSRRPKTSSLRNARFYHCINPHWQWISSCDATLNQRIRHNAELPLFLMHYTPLDSPCMQCSTTLYMFFLQCRAAALITRLCTSFLHESLFSTGFYSATLRGDYGPFYTGRGENKNVLPYTTWRIVLLRESVRLLLHLSRFSRKYRLL